MQQTRYTFAALRALVACAALLASLLAAPATHAQTYEIRTEAATPFDAATTDVVWELADTGYPVDDDKDEVPIGFTFNFGGVDYTTVRILSNGALHFGANQGFHKDYTNEALAITGSVNGPGFEEPADRVVAPYWDDLEPSGGGTVRYDTLGSAPDRRFVVSWENVPHYNLAGTYTFQAVLYENGEIRFRYGASAATGASATIGVEVDDGDFTQHSYNSAGAVGSGTDLVFFARPYFGISHAGNGSTCAVSAVTLTRYDGFGAVDTGYTGTVSLSTSTGNGDWSAGSALGTLVNAGGGSATYTFVGGDAGVAALGLSNPVAETLNVDVTDGTYGEDPGLDADLVFTAGGPTETFRDDFGSDSFSNDDGSQSFAGPWIEVDGAGAGPTAGNARIQNGEIRLDDRPNTGGEPSLEREMDLSGYSSATLAFDFQTSGGVDASDAVVVEASDDGGASWSTLETFTGITGATTGSRSYSLTPYLAANTRIRFRVTNLYGGNNERFDVGYVEVAAAGPCAGTGAFALVHDGSGINCQGEPVVLEARNAGGSVDTGYTGTVVLSTSTAHGDWSVGTAAGTLVNGGAGAATYTFDPADNGSVELVLADTFEETLNIDVVDGSVVEDPAFDPDLTFRRSGFNVLANTVANAVGTQIAGKASDAAPGAQTIELQAIDTNTDTGACEAGLQGTFDVGVAFECRDPGTCGAEQVVVNGVAVAANDAGSVTAYTAVSMDFGGPADGTATFWLRYADAGRLRLHARYELLLGDGSGSGNLMVGASNEFVVRPFAFDVDLSDDREDNGLSGPSYAADANGTAYLKAGEAFDVTVTAVVWDGADDADADGLPDAGAVLHDNAPTPSFGLEATAATAALSHTLVAPGTGAAGSLGGTLTASGFSAGAATATVTFSEVGIIDLTASAADYLGSGVDVGGTVANVGRFYPARFEITDSTLAFRDGLDAGWTCGFTYMDQPFTFDADPVFTVTARNLAGAVTSNYGLAFFKLPTAGPFHLGRDYDDNAGTGAGLDEPDIGVITLAGDDDYDGRFTHTLTGEQLGYTRPAAPIAPFDADLDLTLEAAEFQDDDGVCYHPTDMSCNVNDAIMNVPQDYTVTGIGGTTVRYGRLEITNAAGSELLPLALPVAARYFDGSGFVTAADDTCTDLGTGAIDLANTADDPPQGTATIAVGSGTSTATIANQPMAAGEAGVTFSAPLAGNTGYADVTFNLAVAGGADLEWLRFDWDGDGDHDDDPAGRVTFGVYTGSDVLIHVREPW